MNPDVPTPVLPDPTAELTLLHDIVLAMLVIGVLALVLAVVSTIALWRIFTKAGEHGWAVLVPFYGLFVLLRIAARSPWWLVLALLPLPVSLISVVDPMWMIGPNQMLFGLLLLASLVAEVTVALLAGTGLARGFGRSTTFGVFALTMFPIVGYCILGFGRARYFDRPSAPPASVLV